MLPAVDGETRALLRLAGAVAGSPPDTVRATLEAAAQLVRAAWVEEVILQSYLFAGLPRTLNAMRDWRRLSGVAAPSADDGATWESVAEWTNRGELTCRAVYGSHYDKLRQNIRDLHPALDAWMITEGYGKVLARGALDLRLRELCIVAACAVTQQGRQLYSHFIGALNVGATRAQVSAALDAIQDLMSAAAERDAQQLWKRVQSALKSSALDV
ncbi:MAG: carboxymuconolactone decarboxylase family protein [Gemmatimonadaceae bacterium]